MSENALMLAGSSEKIRGRRRVQFSLRTLLIFSLTAGCGFLLWRNWDPWVRVSYWKFPVGYGQIIVQDHGRVVVASAANPYRAVAYLPAIGKTVEIKSSKGSFYPNGRATLSSLGDRLATRMFSTPFQLWDTATGQEIPLEQNSHGGQFKFSPDGKLLAVITSEGPVQLRRADNGAILRNFDNGYKASLPCEKVFWSPNGLSLVTTIDTQGSVVEPTTVALDSFDTASGKSRFSLKGNGTAVQNLAFSADGKRLISLEIIPGKQWASRVWNYETGELINKFDTYALGLWQAHRSILVGDEKRDGWAEWSLQDGAYVQFFPRAKAYSFENVPLVYKVREQESSDEECSPNGDRMATVRSDGSVHIRQTDHPEMAMFLKSSTAITHAEFFDDKHLVTQDAIGVSVWELRRSESDSSIAGRIEFWCLMLAAFALVWSFFVDLRARKT